MMPRLGETYNIEIETISKPKAEYTTDAYFELDLPVAPAVMVGEEIVVEGSDVSDEKLESVICKQLGISNPQPQNKGILFYVKEKIMTALKAAENGKVISHDEVKKRFLSK